MRATPKRAYVTSPLDLGLLGPRRVCAALVLVIGKIQAFQQCTRGILPCRKATSREYYLFLIRVVDLFIARVSLIRTAARISRCVKVKMKVEQSSILDECWSTF